MKLRPRNIKGHESLNWNGVGEQWGGGPLRPWVLITTAGSRIQSSVSWKGQGPLGMPGRVCTI